MTHVGLMGSRRGDRAVVTLPRQQIAQLAQTTLRQIVAGLFPIARQPVCQTGLIETPRKVRTTGSYALVPDVSLWIESSDAGVDGAPRGFSGNATCAHRVGHQQHQPRGESEIRNTPARHDSLDGQASDALLEVDAFLAYPQVAKH